MLSNWGLLMGQLLTLIQYSLRVSNASQKILVASYIGYVTQAQKIGGHEVVNFFLVEDTQTLQK